MRAMILIALLMCWLGSVEMIRPPSLGRCALAAVGADGTGRGREDGPLTKPGKSRLGPASNWRSILTILRE
jgi:hypothetical protein